MTSGFSFELGVFSGGFVPSALNTADWHAHWVPAQRLSYDATAQRFNQQYSVSSNIAPFSKDTDAYVWGFQGGVAASEWLLFRNETWSWPAPVGSPPSPTGLYWNAAEASAVLGTVNAAGSPFLMQSAAVTDAASPATSWSQWQAHELAGEALNGPADDPDHDGTSNLLEYVFGTAPRQAGAPPATPVALVGGHLQITIPRRSDHPATLVVQVSADLTIWEAGPAFTAETSNSPAAWVVRDLTPLDPAHPRRFMRLQAELAPGS